jgi:gliding motility-associated-like protein
MADTGYHVVTFQGTDDGDPVMTSTLTIIIHVLPSPQIEPGSLLVCDNDAAVDMLTVRNGSPTPGGIWTAPDGSGHNGTFIPGEDLSGDYVYVVSSGGICSATGIATIANVPHAYAGEDTALAYCSWDYPDALFPHIPGMPQDAGAWLTPDGIAFDGIIDPPTSTPGTYLYVVTPPTPCPNDTAAVQVAIPQAVHAGTDSSILICRDTPPFSMRGKLGGQVDTTGIWTNTLGQAVPDTFDPASGEIGVYTYTVPAVLPCPDQSATLTINLDALPNAGIDSALVICANGGDYPLFPLLGGGPDTGGHWLDPLGAPMEGVLDPTLEISGGYAYVVFGPGTCVHLTDTAMVKVHIDPLAVISFIADPDSGCNPLQVLFTNTTDSIYVGNSCIWDPGDGTDPVQQCGSFAHTYQQAGWYHVKLQVTTPQGCTSQLIAPGAVLVDPAPLASFLWTPNPGTPENSNLVFTATDPHAVEFHWTIDNDDFQSGQQVAHLFTDQIGGEYPVCLSVLDRYGCADTLCDTVPVIIPDLFVPLAFTPDGNGVNDVFLPISTDIVANDYEMSVFDRWGQIVFHSKDPNEGWDGKGKNGKDLPTGTYVWRISFRPVYTSDKTDRFGTITLMK